MLNKMITYLLTYLQKRETSFRLTGHRSGARDTRGSQRIRIVALKLISAAALMAEENMR